MKYFFRRLRSKLKRMSGYTRARFRRNAAKFQSSAAGGAELVDRMPGIEMPMVIHPAMFLRTAYTDAYFEADCIHFMQDTVRRGWMTADVGANVGFFSLLLAKLVGKSGQVHAFEPADFASGLLAKNREINDLTQLHIHKVALGDKNDADVIFYEGSPGMEVYNSLEPVTHYAAEKAAFRETSVRMVTGDEWFAKNGVERIDFMKIDVEGAELLVLAGFQKLIRERRIGWILFEADEELTKNFGYTVSDIQKVFEAAGYRLFTLGRMGRLETFAPGTKATGHMLVASMVNAL